MMFVDEEHRISFHDNEDKRLRSASQMACMVGS